MRDENQDDVGVHIAKILKMWCEVKDLYDDVYEHRATWRLIETLPNNWRALVEDLYLERVCNDPEF